MLIGGTQGRPPTGSTNWRITQWLMPWYNIVARDGDGPITEHAWVPIDDGKLLGVEHHVQPRQAADQDGKPTTTGGAGEGRATRKVIPGTYLPVRKRGQRLPDRPDAAANGVVPPG